MTNTPIPPEPDPQPGPHPDDIRAIHVLQAKLGMADDSYRIALGAYGVHSSKDLTFAQARAFRTALQMAWDSAQRATKANVRHYVTPAIIKRIRFHAIPCAIEYCPDLGTYVNDATGEILTGDALRAWMGEQWERGRVLAMQNRWEPTVPQSLMARLYTGWINPKANGWLVEAGFRRSVRQPERLTLTDLQMDAGQLLVDRFRAIHSVLQQRDQRAQPPISEDVP